jgi:methylated-DNA-[protein]-cysteine S-methyltransferase
MLKATARWLHAYWARTPDGGPAPALDLSSGTPFQRAVWAALLSIPSGGTSTYAAIAAAAGSPAAVRAAGAAIGRNPVSLVVPCHRVLGSGGALTGYAGGLERKRALLAHEGAIAA